MAAACCPSFVAATKTDYGESYPTYLSMVEWMCLGTRRAFVLLWVSQFLKDCLQWNKRSIHCFRLPFLFVLFCRPVNVQVPQPRAEEGAFEYVLTVERYNPDTQSPEQYRQVAGLQISDFPYTLQNLPVGYYRTVVNAVTLTGLKAVGGSVFAAGTPSKPCSHFFKRTQYSSEIILLWAHSIFRVEASKVVKQTFR